MKCLQTKWGTYELDASGFLEDPSVWSRDFAEGIAQLMPRCKEMTLLHWKAVFFVRKRFERAGDIARIHETCRHCNLTLSAFYKLFPAGYQRGVCRLAGIPYDFIVSNHFALTYETIRRNQA